MIDTVFIFVDSFLEVLCLLAIVSIVNINATLDMARRIFFAGVLAALAFVMDVNSVPFHSVFSLSASVALFLALKRPAKTFIWSYVIDLLISHVVLALFQFVIIAPFGFFGVDLIDHEAILACIMIALIIFLRWLSYKICLHIFIEKYYTPYRAPIIFAIISMLFLITILINITTHSNKSFLASSEAGQFYLIIFGYMAVNLFFAVSMYWGKRAHDKNALIMQYSEHLQDIVNNYRASDHDAKHHLQIMINLNTTSDGEVMNKELDAYFKTLANIGNQYDDTSIIKDDVLISALLKQKRAYAKQNRIRFTVSIMCLLTDYSGRVPNTELIDMLGNLINNAFEETVKLDEENRIVELDFADYYIEIRNKVSLSFMKNDSGATERLFEQGYSTKGAGRGFGLSNVLSIAQKNNIKINQSMADGFIVFRLRLHK